MQNEELIIWLFNNRMINAKRTSTYHHILEIYKGYICLSDETVNKNIENEKLILSRNALMARSFKVVKDEDVPDKVKEHFGMLNELKEGQLVCANPGCGEIIDHGKYCTRGCANKHKAILGTNKRKELVN